MLQIDTEQLLYTSTRRMCYRLADNPSWCVKLPKNESKQAQFANQLEWRAYQVAVKKAGDNLANISAECKGFVETNLGTALMCECINQPNMQVSPMLLTEIKRADSARKKQLIGYVDTLLSILLAQKLRLFDVNPCNLLVQKLDSDTERLVIIDWKSTLINQESIPISSWFWYFAQQKMHRRFANLRQTILKD